MEAAAAGARQAGHEITNHHKLHGMDTNCAVHTIVCYKHQAPLPSGSVSVFLSNKCHGKSSGGGALLLSPVLLCAQVGDWKMVGFEE